MKKRTVGQHRRTASDATNIKAVADHGGGGGCGERKRKRNERRERKRKKEEEKSQWEQATEDGKNVWSLGFQMNEWCK